MMAGMRQLAREAERVITAKIAEDFGHAVTVSSMGAASACFGRTTVTRLATLPRHRAYNKARGFNLDDVEHLPASAHAEVLAQVSHLDDGHDPALR
jgi:hypothetical protein